MEIRAQLENKTKRPSLGKRSLSLPQPRPRGVWGVGVDNTCLTANQHPLFGVLSLLRESSRSEPKMYHFTSKAGGPQHLSPILTLGFTDGLVGGGQTKALEMMYYKAIGI